MSSAVHFLNQRRITHCDIKLENILLDELGQVKLYDFKFDTQLVEGQMLQDLWQSLAYWALEILARKPYDGMAADMWNLGIVLYGMVTGHFPYEKSTIEVIFCLITTTVCPMPNHLIKPCYIILARLLTVYIWFGLPSSRLVERPLLCHIEEHITPEKEILPQVVKVMCQCYTSQHWLCLQRGCIIPKTSAVK